MKKVIKQIYPARVKKPATYSLKKKKLVANQEKLKREVQNMKSSGDTKNNNEI